MAPGTGLCYLPNPSAPRLLGTLQKHWKKTSTLPPFLCPPRLCRREYSFPWITINMTSNFFDICLSSCCNLPWCGLLVTLGFSLSKSAGTGQGEPWTLAPFTRRGHLSRHRAAGLGGGRKEKGPRRRNQRPTARAVNAALGWNFAQWLLSSQPLRNPSPIAEEGTELRGSRVTSAPGTRSPAQPSHDPEIKSHRYSDRASQMSPKISFKTAYAL